MDPKERIQALVRAWNAHDIESFAALLSAEVEWFDLGMTHPPARGRAEVISFGRSIFAAFPDLKYSINEPICVAPDERRFVIFWTIEATHTGMLVPPGFAPTNRRVVMSGVDALQFKGGEIISILTLFDPISAAEQLTGITLRFPAGSLRERAAVFVQRVIALFARKSKARRPC